MKEFLAFLAAIAGPLQDLFTYVTYEKPDPEKERQIGLRIIRKAQDEAMRKELGG